MDLLYSVAQSVGASSIVETSGVARKWSHRKVTGHFDKVMRSEVWAATMINLSDHALLSMRKRGALRSEVIDTIHTGTEYPAYLNRLGKEKVFRDGYEYEGRSYPHKQIRVIYVEEGPVTEVVTVIARYGEWIE